MSEAVAYLRRYQAWRRGEDERTMEEAGIEPKELGKAIDDVCAEVETWREVSRNQDIALDKANSRIAEIMSERDHWKANHDNQVERERLLIERDDMPIERIRAYQKHEEYRTGWQRYEKLRKLNPSAYRDLWLKHINGDDSFDDLVDSL